VAAPEPMDGLSPVKRALVEIRRLKEELTRERQRRSEPIAIVGAGVRFPGGADTIERFWEMLMAGTDAIGPMPRERWDHNRYFDPAGERPDTYYIDQGGFLEDIDQFDPEFFGIAPLEASMMDPQQRLLLETAWEAFENAGISARSLHGSNTGVFVGIGTTDYHRLLMAHGERIDAYASSGTALSVAAGRISYLLGFHGPSISVDTACSSSLVAVHLACQALRIGESDIAIAGGVNVMVAPELTVDFCSAGMLSHDGRCKTFDAAADGYVRSEGCGVIVLKRLSDAQRDGDRIHAVIRGSAVNQDGRSSGLTAPSGPAQEAVIRNALENAGLKPSDIGYVEAHGTGTSLGDPIEVHALGSVFADRSAAQPLLIGSVKTNVGHLEAAAGIAGLIKAMETVRHGVIPPHLNYTTPNPHISWAQYPIAVVPAAQIKFPGSVPRAGVSSFGFSGTNAHVIIEAPPAAAASSRAATDEPAILTLSAPRESGLRALASAYAAYLTKTREAFTDICATANAGRSVFAHRLAISAHDNIEAGRKLQSWLAGAEVPGLWIGTAHARMAGAVAFGADGMRDARSIAQLFVNGVEIDWRELSAGSRRVVLPTYPFERRRFWFTERAQSPRGQSNVDTWQALTAAADEQAALAPIDVNLAQLAEGYRALDSVAEVVGHNALMSLGAFTRTDVCSIDDVLHETGIAKLYEPIVRRWLDAMTRRGALERTPGGYRATAPLSPIDAAPYWQEAARHFNEDDALLSYARHSAELVADVLSGRVSPLETLFPGGSFDVAANLYEKSAVLRYVNAIAARALQALLTTLPADKAVRVMEVGAGTGGTTSSLLRVLPSDRATYTYTDVSDVFLEFGRAKFADVACLRTAIFDLEASPEAQGFKRASFDVVVASNAVHAAKDLPAALGRVRSLLAPNGILLLVESTAHHAWHDMSTGLIEGWQHFVDDLRKDTPLLPASTWLEVLHEAGFVNAAAFPRDNSAAAVLKQQIIIAQAGTTVEATADASVAIASEVQVHARAQHTPADTPAEVAIASNGASNTNAAAPATGGVEHTFHVALRAAVGAERQTVACNAVRECVIEILRADPDRPPAFDARLMELGVDSLMAVRLRNLLQKRLGLATKKLPATLIFDYPTIRQIAELAISFVLGNAGALAEQKAPAPVAAEAAPAASRAAELAAMSEADVIAMLDQLHAEGMS